MQKKIIVAALACALFNVQLNAVQLESSSSDEAF